jgi:predicted dehydrogenase
MISTGKIAARTRGSMDEQSLPPRLGHAYRQRAISLQVSRRRDTDANGDPWRPAFRMAGSPAWRYRFPSPPLARPTALSSKGCSMASKLRLAIVGTGMIAESHVPAALATPGVELAALVDPAVERANSLALRYGIRALVAPSFGDVIGSVDAALIATPNDTHAPLALECIAAGLPVLVEKPLSTSYAEGEAVVRAAEAAGVPLAVGYSTRFQWNVQLMKQLLRSGQLVRPRRFAYQSGSAGGWSSYSGFHLDRRAVGGGVLVTMGTHFIDRMLDWFGMPSELEYADDSLGGPEANALARLVFGAGETQLAGSVRFSRTVLLRGGFVLETDLGTAILHEDPVSPVRFRTRAYPAVESELRPRTGVVEATAKGTFRLQLEDFAAACRQGRPPLVTGRASLASQKLVESLYERRIPLDTDPYNSVDRNAA